MWLVCHSEVFDQFWTIHAHGDDDDAGEEEEEEKGLSTASCFKSN